MTIKVTLLLKISLRLNYYYYYQTNMLKNDDDPIHNLLFPIIL